MEGSAAWRLTGFLIHLAPSFALIGVLALAWTRPRIGGALFIVAGLSPLVLLHNELWTNLLLGAPFLLAGAGFLGASLVRPERR